MNVAPAIGVMPSTSKNCQVTAWPGIRSASPPLPVSVRPPPAIAAIDVNVCCCSLQSRKLRGATRLCAKRGDALPQHDEAIGLGEGEWSKERGVHEAEHRAVGADADRQHDDGDSGEAGSAPQRAGGVAKVAPDGHAG